MMNGDRILPKGRSTKRDQLPSFEWGSLVTRRIICLHNVANCVPIQTSDQIWSYSSGRTTPGRHSCLLLPKPERDLRNYVEPYDRVRQAAL
jgi:hypothetical protein